MPRAGIPAWHLPEEILGNQIAKLPELPMAGGALGDGRRAARDIDRVPGAEPLAHDPETEVLGYGRLDTAYVRNAPRSGVPLAHAEARRAGHHRLKEEEEEDSMPLNQGVGA